MVELDDVAVSTEPNCQAPPVRGWDRDSSMFNHQPPLNQWSALMPYLMKRMLRATRSAGIVFDPVVNDRFWRPVGIGMPLTPDVIAATPNPILVMGPRRGEIPDIFGDLLGPWLVRPVIKDIIEELEPGVHGFIPVEVKKEKTGKDYGRFFVLHIVQAIDAVVIEKTDFIEGPGRVNYEKSSTFGLIGQITLQGVAIAGRHLWRGARGEFGRTTPFSYEYFCSDELRDRIKAGRYFGLDFRKCTVE